MGIDTCDPNANNLKYSNTVVSIMDGLIKPFLCDRLCIVLTCFSFLDGQEWGFANMNNNLTNHHNLK